MFRLILFYLLIVLVNSTAFNSKQVNIFNISRDRSEQIDSNIEKLNHIITLSKTISVCFYTKTTSYMICEDSLFKDFINNNRDFISPSKNLKNCKADQYEGRILFFDADQNKIYTLYFSLITPSFYFNINDNQAYRMSEKCISYLKKKKTIAMKLNSITHIY
jgi:hypothetical protein